MKYKYILAITILSISVLMFNGCGKNDAEPVTSETIEESVNTEESGETEEIEEPDQGINEGVAIDRNNSTGEESTTGGSSVEVSGETVGNTTLTQEEIDALKASATTDSEKKGLEAYESIINTGSWVGSGGGTWDKVVGTPGDTSWRRMTDAEAQAIINKGKPDPWDNPDGYLEYEAAEAELSNGTWSGVLGETGTIYFDYYQWKEDSAKANEQWRADHADELGDSEIDDSPLDINPH